MRYLGYRKITTKSGNEVLMLFTCLPITKDGNGFGVPQKPYFVSPAVKMPDASCVMKEIDLQYQSDAFGNPRITGIILK